MFRLLAVTSAVVLAAATPDIAAAQSVPCSDRTKALEYLTNTYAEAPVAMGLTNNGAVLEVLASEAGDSWTIMVTMPNGTACMIAAGESWEPVVGADRLGDSASAQE